VEGRGAAGDGGEAGRRQAGTGAALEVGDGADGWVPSVRERREEGEVNGALGRVGRKWNWAAAEKKERRKKNVGRGLGWVCFFFFFSFFKPISNPFKFKTFTCFQIQILTQISPTILKAFHKLFFYNFSNIFLIQTFTQIFTNFFTIILRIFFTNILRLLKPHHNQNSCIST
jgi:hypothetical protein